MGAEKKQNEHGSKIKHLSKRVEIEGKNKNTSGNSSSCSGQSSSIIPLELVKQEKSPRNSSSCVGGGRAKKDEKR